MPQHLHRVQSGGWPAVGIAVGLPLALRVAAFAVGFVDGVELEGGVPLLITTLILAGAGVLASYGPAQKAVNVHPAEVLRHD